MGGEGLSKAKKILVIPNIGMGDALISLMVQYKLRVMFPNAVISVICWGERWEPVYSGNPYTNVSVIMNPPFEPGVKPAKLTDRSAELVKKVCADNDFVISLTGVPAMEMAVKSVKGPEQYFLWRPENFKEASTYYENISAQINALLGVDVRWHPYVTPSLPGTLSEPLRNYVASNLKGKKTAVIVAAAGSALRRLPVEMMMKIYMHLTNREFTPVVLVPPPPDKEIYHDFIKSNHLRAIEIGNLKETFDFISQASLYVGPDTGFSHYAALKGIATIVFMGPSNKWFRPYGERASAINFGEECPHQKTPCDSSARCALSGGAPECFKSFNVVQLDNAMQNLKLPEGF
ncbi:MAG: hypothetical protein LLG37_09810 [Spirochaetia bacterium]|nr:hypothetical protein [Spirochaetia bacterium]